MLGTALPITVGSLEEVTDGDADGEAIEGSLLGVDETITVGTALRVTVGSPDTVTEGTKLLSTLGLEEGPALTLGESLGTLLGL